MRVPSYQRGKLTGPRFLSQRARMSRSKNPALSTDAHESEAPILRSYPTSQQAYQTVVTQAACTYWASIDVRQQLHGHVRRPHLPTLPPREPVVTIFTPPSSRDPRFLLPNSPVPTSATRRPPQQPHHSRLNRVLPPQTCVKHGPALAAWAHH